MNKRLLVTVIFSLIICCIFTGCGKSEDSSALSDKLKGNISDLS